MADQEIDDRAPARPSAIAPALAEAKPSGVARVEVLSRVISMPERLFLLFSLFIVSYVYSLDNTSRNAYQPYALSSFNEHSLLPTVAVLGTVIGAALQPISAKLSDVFGRVEIVALALFFYAIGTIVQATSHNMGTFSGGVVLWEIGHTSVLFIVQILVADFTSTRWRVLFSFLPVLPTLINTWVSGSITSAVLKHAGWHWGIGMWAIVVPMTSLPIFVTIYIIGHRAKKQSVIYAEQVRAQTQAVRRSPWRFAVEIFWMVDVIGVFLMVALLALTLVPFTLAGGIEKKWHQAHIVAPLVIGFVLIPVFVLWELRAPKPLIPFELLKQRVVWAPICIGVLQNCTFVLVAAYLFTILQVSFGFSIASATRISSLYGFVNAVVCPFLGFAVYKTRRLKYFVVAGAAVYTAGMGMLIHFRGSTSTAGLHTSRTGVIAAEVVLGVGGGVLFYAAQTALQVQIKHEHLAAVTGVSLAFHYIGSALGATLSGALWTQLLPSRLEAQLAPINSTLAAIAYANPLMNIVPVYPLGTPERTGVIAAYQSIQRILVITAMCLSIPMILLALALPNPELTDAQNLIDGDTELEPEDKKVVDMDETIETKQAPVNETAPTNAVAGAKGLDFTHTSNK
ncbi:ferrioxamine B transporter [Sporothrix epigloea]|uniref:Ferrioxamine B transporter n=1 Tax=Sporothrix epigloea TaxID=1892477 RepID=A0ABP0E3W9_9PEZI